LERQVRSAHIDKHAQTTRRRHFCDEHGKAQKPITVQDHSQGIGYIDKEDKMANSYSVSPRTWK